jgi:hypothetical protein
MNESLLLLSPNESFIRIGKRLILHFLLSYVIYRVSLSADSKFVIEKIPIGHTIDLRYNYLYFLLVVATFVDIFGVGE